MSPGLSPHLRLAVELGSLALPRLHEFYGSGHSFDLGPKQDQAVLEVYPEAQMVRFSSEGVNVAFRAQEQMATQGAVVFDAGDGTTTEHRTMVVNRDGGMTLFVSPRHLIPTSELNDEAFDEHPDLLGCRSCGAASDTQLCTSCQGGGEVLPEPIEVVAEPVSVLPEPSAPASANGHVESSNTKVETNKGDRVVVTGRAGRDPRLTQTKTGTPVAKFPLGEHVMDGESETTTWHTIVTFRDRALEVMDSVKKGDTLKVAGYRHVRPGKDGKDTTEIYAASVRPPSKPKSNGG